MKRDNKKVMFMSYQSTPNNMTISQFHKRMHCNTQIFYAPPQSEYQT